MIKGFAFAAAVLIWAMDTPLADPRQEARARALMREIRCVACENEPISQSSAPIAEDMRARVRDLIADGASDREVRDWFVSRYDTFVLFRPPSRGWQGVLLWGTPFAMLFCVAGGLIAIRQKRCSDPPISEAAEVVDHENDI